MVQHSCHVSFKSMQGCRRSWEDKLWCDGRTEWRTKQTLNAPLPFHGGGIKIMVWCERSCDKEYTCELWKPYLLQCINYDQGKRFLKSRSNIKVTRSTRVSVETGALLVYSCLITYKHFSQRYQVNMMIYKGFIVNRVNPYIGSMYVLWMFQRAIIWKR